MSSEILPMCSEFLLMCSEFWFVFLILKCVFEHFEMCSGILFHVFDFEMRFDSGLCSDTYRPPYL